MGENYWKCPLLGYFDSFFAETGMRGNSSSFYFMKKSIRGSI